MLELIPEDMMLELLRALEGLVVSVREKGILQPLVVRSNPDGPGYVLIAGERRFRAAQRLNLRDVPVLVKDVASDEAFELALIENIQREDLNPIEEALAYERLLIGGGLTQETLANRLGKSRPAIANSRRLLKLPEALHLSSPVAEAVPSAAWGAVPGQCLPHRR